MPRWAGVLAAGLSAALAAACASPLPPPRPAPPPVERAAEGPRETAPAPEPAPAPPVAPAAPAPLSPELLFAPPAVADPLLSPDGELVAWRVPEAPAELRLARVDTPRNVLLVPSAGEWDALVDFAWLDERRLVVLRRGQGGWRVEVAALGADGAPAGTRAAWAATEGEPALVALVAGPPARALVAVRRAEADEHRLLAVEVETGAVEEPAELARGGGDVERWLVDAGGVPRAAVRHGADGSWSLSRLAGGRLAEPLLGCAPEETCRVLAVAADGRHATLATDRGGAARVAPATVDLTSGELVPVRLSAADRWLADRDSSEENGEATSRRQGPATADGSAEAKERVAAAGAAGGATGGAESPAFVGAELAVDDPSIRDFGGALFSRDGRLLAAWPAGEPFRPAFADPELVAEWRRLAAGLPSGELDLVSSSDSGGRLLAVADLAGAVLLVDLAAGEVRELLRLWPELDPSRRPLRVALHYSARDGLPIPAVLTLPPGSAAPPPPAGSDPGGEAAAAPSKGSALRVPAVPLPAVVLPPDDPWSPRRGGRQPLVALLADRGYAVLQPAPRGSAGFGRAFRAAGERQWGGAMLDDLADGVGWMVERGIADPDRVAIVGFGWGGYAAVAALAFTPDLYVAGVSVDGPVDLESLVRESRDPLSAAVLRRRVGDPDHAEEHRRLRRHSPLAHAGAIRAPLLRIDLEGGAWADPEGSARLIGVLRELGRPVEAFSVVGSGGRLEGAAGVAVASAVERFLAEHLGGGTAAATVPRLAGAASRPPP